MMILAWTPAPAPVRTSPTPAACSTSSGRTWAGLGLMEPRCHLIVTGIADDEVCERTRRAFSQVLLRDDEMAEALSWAGVDDGLSDWFGESA